MNAYIENFFWVFSTYLLAPYFCFRIFLRKTWRRPATENLKILVIQTAKIGDLVCATPVFQAIKKKFPSSCLSALVTSKTKDILKNNPRLDEIILITDFPGIMEKIRLMKKLRKAEYDWVINLCPTNLVNKIIAFWSLVANRVTTTYKYSGKTTKSLSVFNNFRLEYQRNTPILKHRLALLGFMGIKGCSEEKEIFVQPEEEKNALDFLNRNGLSSNDLLVGIGVVPGNKIKQWGLDKFANLADQLAGKLKARIIFTGSADDRIAVAKVQKMMQNSSINACGCFELYELPALLKTLKLFISMDTGPLYIANTVGAPVIVISGPCDAQEQSPSGDKVRIIQTDIDCAPCSFVIATPRSCKEGHSRCLKETFSEQVFEAAVKLLHNEKKES